MTTVDDAARHLFARHLRGCADVAMAHVRDVEGPVRDRSLRAAWMFDDLRLALAVASDAHVTDRCRALARFVDEGVDPRSRVADRLRDVGTAWQRACEHATARDDVLDPVPDWRGADAPVRYAALVADARGRVLRVWLDRVMARDATAARAETLALALDDLRVTALRPDGSEDVAARAAATSRLVARDEDPLLAGLSADLDAAWRIAVAPPLT